MTRLELPMPKILLTSLKLTIPIPEWEQLANSYAPAFDGLPGLRWKIWLLNAEDAEVAGVYLFEDEVSLRAYLHGPIVESLKTASWLRDLQLREYGIMAAETERTGAGGPTSSSIPQLHNQGS
jgi:hypothetical protein